MEDLHMFDHCVVNFCSDISSVSIFALHKHGNNTYKFTLKHLTAVCTLLAEEPRSVSEVLGHLLPSLGFTD